MKALWAIAFGALIFTPVRNEDGTYGGIGYDRVSRSYATRTARRANIASYELSAKTREARSSLQAAAEIASVRSSCPEDGTEIDGTCFWMSFDRDAWRPARKQCQNHGGDLAIFRNETEEAVITRTMKDVEKAWIGLRRVYGSNVFRWNDGSNLTYANWAEEQPEVNATTKLCVAKHGTNLTWDVNDCDVVMNFMCRALKGVCSGDIRADSGTLVSPNYPKPYGPNLRCAWNITVPEGYVVQLWFSSFELEEDEHCSSDSVKILDGHELDSPVLAHLCGATSPGTIRSSTNKMSLIFSSDDDDIINFKGFSAVFSKGKACVNPNGTGSLIWTSYQGYCYTVYTKARYDWYSATSLCHNNGARLASIHSAEELTFLRSLHAGPLHSWIGLRSSGSSFFYEWSDDTILDFQSWDQNAIYNEGSSSHRCVYMDMSTGLWHKHECSDTLPLICKYRNREHDPVTAATPAPVAPPAFCWDGWSRLGLKCYQLFGSRFTDRQIWTDAKKKCKDLGSTLMSIHSREEQEFLMTNLSRTYTQVWTGMYYLASEKKFDWSDNSTFDFEDWAEGEPNFDGEQKECVYISLNNSEVQGWRAGGCNTWLPYICQITRGILCDADSCRNGGKCSQDPDSGLPRCSCPFGYRGHVCEELVVPENSNEVTSSRLFFLLAIPLVIVCLALLFLIIRRLRRTKKPYNHLYKTTVEFENPQFMDNITTELENSDENLESTHHELSLLTNSDGSYRKNYPFMY